MWWWTIPVCFLKVIEFSKPPMWWWTLHHIAFGKLQEQSVDGKFNRFGLSKIATVPIF
jgi:hypothetical protein